jgi:hypothetical protein
MSAECRQHCRSIMPRIDALQAAWFLDALEGMGVPQNDPLVRRARSRLNRLREPNGMWYGSDPEVTLFAVRLLEA